MFRRTYLYVCTQFSHASSCGLSVIFILKKKVKCILVQTLRLCTCRTGSRGIAVLFLDHGTRRGEGSASRPGRSLLPEKAQYPLYRRLGGPQGRSGQVWKISPPPGFDSRTVQPVASRYTDYATRPTIVNKPNSNSKYPCCFPCYSDSMLLLIIYLSKVSTHT